MRRNRRVIRSNTPTTRADYIMTALFWVVVLGYPAFVALYRWLH